MYAKFPAFCRRRERMENLPSAIFGNCAVSKTNSPLASVIDRCKPTQEKGEPRRSGARDFVDLSADLSLVRLLGRRLRVALAGRCLSGRILLDRGLR